MRELSVIVLSCSFIGMGPRIDLSLSEFLVKKNFRSYTSKLVTLSQQAMVERKDSFKMLRSLESGARRATGTS